MTTKIRRREVVSVGGGELWERRKRFCERHRRCSPSEERMVKMILRSATKTVSINAPREAVFKFLANPANWPQWAIVNVKSIWETDEFFDQQMGLIDQELARLKEILEK